MLNSQVGSYRIEQRLAQGGMGEVYLARHELIDREAVVKVLHPKLSHDSDLVTRFFNEAKAVAKIQHPGIVELYEFNYTRDGRAFIVMEYLRGETLASRLDRQQVSLDKAIAIVKQLGSALEAAHANDITHRDLKPENIFLVPDRDLPGGERVKVLDFGVAKLAPRHQSGNLTATGTIFGTPAYMAPEQCTDAATVDHRADLYAIGCIFYELLCGEPPFGRGGLELLAAHLRDQPEPPNRHNPSIPSDVNAAILCLLAKDPAERFQSCDALIRALDRADLMAGIAAQPSQPAQPDIAYAATVPPTQTQSSSPPEQRATEIALAPTAHPARTVQPEQPTTHRRAAGQVQLPTEPPQSRKRGVAIVALAVLALGAGGAFALVRSSQQTASDNETPAVTRPAAVAGEPAQDLPQEGPEEGPIDDERIARARQAIATGQWADAAFFARTAVEDPEASPRVRAAAEELLTAANMERDAKHYYDTFRRAVAAKAGVKTIAFAYEQLPETSTYRAQARADYERIRDKWLAPRLKNATRHVKKKNCKRVDKIRFHVEALFEESAAPFEELYEQCVAKEKAKGTSQAEPGSQPGKEGQAGEDPETGDKTKPAKPPKPGDGGKDNEQPKPDQSSKKGEQPGGGEKAQDKAPRPGEQPSNTGKPGKDPPKGETKEHLAARKTAQGQEMPEVVSKAEFNEKMAEARDLLKECAKLHKITGDFTFKVVIAPRGRLQKASVTPKPNGKFRRCARKRMKAFRFPRAKKASKMEYTMSFGEPEKASKKKRRK